MYAKIVTLLALFLGSLSGVTAASQSVRGDDATENTKTVERVETERQTILDKNPVPANEGDPARDERRSEGKPEEPADEPLLGCHTTDGTLNPEVEAFANQHSLAYESVLSWYCAGFSFEVIQNVYDMSILAGVSIDDIYQMRVVEGYTWDQVLQELGITFSREGQPFILDKEDHDNSDE